MILVTSRCCCFISAHHDMTWLCSGTGGLCFQCVAETSGRNGSVRHQCCHQLGPWRCSTGGSSEALQRLAKTRSQSAGPVHHCVTDKVWGWHWLSRWCYCSVQANANKELRLVELWFKKKKRFCLSDRPHLLLLFLHLTTSDLGFLLFFYVSDMKTRKWSFSLEDYKQLSKCVCLCFFSWWHLPSCLTVLCAIPSGSTQWDSSSGGGASTQGTDPSLLCQVWR